MARLDGFTENLVFIYSDAEFEFAEACKAVASASEDLRQRVARRTGDFSELDFKFVGQDIERGLEAHRRVQETRERLQTIRRLVFRHASMCEAEAFAR